MSLYQTFRAIKDIWPLVVLTAVVFWALVVLVATGAWQIYGERVVGRAREELKVDQIANQVDDIAAQLRRVNILLETGGVAPRIVEFDGRGIVTDDSDAVPGGQIIVTYSLRRNATCETVVFPRFYDIDRGVTFNGEPFNAVRAPVTDDFALFSLPVPLPLGIAPGRYTYVPEIAPRDCQPYGRMTVIPTDPFIIRPAETGP